MTDRLWCSNDKLPIKYRVGGIPSSQPKDGGLHLMNEESVHFHSLLTGSGMSSGASDGLVPQREQLFDIVFGPDEIPNLSACAEPVGVIAECSALAEAHMVACAPHPTPDGRA